MPRYTTVLFDLDGTLLDTLDDLTGSVNFALESAGYPLRTREEVRGFVGNGVGVLIRRALPQEVPQGEWARALATLKSHYAQHSADQTRPYEGIPELLQTLRDMGCKLAIASNKNDENVKALCKEHFGDILALGEGPGMACKPAPDMIRAAMSALGANPAQTLYVGDSDVDLQTARNAGLTCLCVTWGFRSQEELRTAGATQFAHSPGEIVDFIK